MHSSSSCSTLSSARVAIFATFFAISGSAVPLLAADELPPKPTESYSGDPVHDWRTRLNGTHSYAKFVQYEMIRLGCLAPKLTNGKWGTDGEWHFSPPRRFKIFLASAKLKSTYDPTGKLSEVLAMLRMYVPDGAIAKVPCKVKRADGSGVFAKCDLPALRKKWIADHGVKGKLGLQTLIGDGAADDTIGVLGAMTSNGDVALNRYYPTTIKRPKAVQPSEDWIKMVMPSGGSNYSYTSDRNALSSTMTDLADKLRQSLNYVVASASFSCNRCVLLQAYEDIESEAETIVGLDVKVLKGESGRLAIATDAITFAMLADQIAAIRKWKARTANAPSLDTIITAFLDKRAEDIANNVTTADDDKPFSQVGKWSDNCSEFVTLMAK